ncbi:N-acetylglucosamine kinase [Cecembia calidifontis]|jgi:N-acetylglucosamine kinase-like BadF-type ATPase|uniref:N-acetylglucosamine kinase-like BadF-type ATPase n=1 Tax=Cecembia calidifontis TaxID=1187080 RepID=A0A4Q7P6M7_9BACT|nr:N-acetylglucosamine kinase [Cecembia calidifontis]RZS95746.1 N-acetylglucosamine kinase-like BadF-type ATPase [Cecembia calidifontis]
MILIADSGASKTDWRLINKKGEIAQHRGIGFNPNYQTAAEMASDLQDEFLLNLRGEVDVVYYYGAGCTSAKNREQVENGLRTVFRHAEIFVDHDMMAAARATCGHEAGIACILGTGSNSCDYDGEVIIDKRPAPGYILGDEGGGAYIGRKFLADFIHEEMPKKIREKVLDKFQLDTQTIIENVYQRPFPGRYMASFCRFITENKSEPYCYMLYYNAFQDFFKKHVMKYENYKKKKVNFVGSIAFYNSDILRSAAYDADIHVNLIIESPIAGLSLFHQNLL